jgi:hypothetical protein
VPLPPQHSLRDIEELDDLRIEPIYRAAVWGMRTVVVSFLIPWLAPYSWVWLVYWLAGIGSVAMIPLAFAIERLIPIPSGRIARRLSFDLVRPTFR